MQDVANISTLVAAAQLAEADWEVVLALVLATVGAVAFILPSASTADCGGADRGFEDADGDGLTAAAARAFEVGQGWTLRG